MAAQASARPGGVPRDRGRVSPTRVLELVRDDHDRPSWRPVATVAHGGRLEVVWSVCAEEVEPPPGTYRLERGGARLDVHHTGVVGR